MTDCVDMICTDFGVVKLSPKVTGYLDSIAPDWRTNKRSKRVREAVDGLVDAVSLLARIEHHAGGELTHL